MNNAARPRKIGRTIVDAHERDSDDEEEHTYMVDCDIRVQQIVNGAPPFIRSTKKTTVTFSCAGMVHLRCN